MVKSMTGYGRCEYEEQGIVYLVEIRSVNHRFCEIIVRMPREWQVLEDEVKKRIQEHVKRGRVDVHIAIEARERPKRRLEVDWNLLRAYLDVIQQLRAELKVGGEISVQQLIQLPDVIVEKEEAMDVARYAPGLLTAVDRAVQELLAMREKEGSALRQDLRGRVRHIESLIDDVAQKAPLVAREYRERLWQRVREWLENKGELDEARLMAEVAIFADKANIEEELIRLRSHCRQFVEILDVRDPVGRKLDFLVQEMNREMNTIGAKANNLFISQKVIDMKSELEKVKEQVQNVE
ncbi:YicC family protein [Bacillaceae bacterium]